MASSEIETIVGAIKTILASVSGIKNVYEYEPEAPGAAPFIMFALGPWEAIPSAYGEMALKWTLPGYLAVEQTNFKAAEAKIRTLLPLIIDRFGAELSANGMITDGQALLEGGRRGRLTIANTAYHAMEITMTVVEHFPYNRELGDD